MGLRLNNRTDIHVLADPEQPESALNAIPKAVLQRARGTVAYSGIVNPLTLI